MVSAAVVGDSSCSQKLTNRAKIVASQTRMAKPQELTGIFATVIGSLAVVANTISLSPNYGCFATRAQFSCPETSMVATKR